jgi:hypothetical protein
MNEWEGGEHLMQKQDKWKEMLKDSKIDQTR